MNITKEDVEQAIISCPNCHGKGSTPVYVRGGIGGRDRCLICVGLRLLLETLKEKQATEAEH